MDVASTNLMLWLNLCFLRIRDSGDVMLCESNSSIYAVPWPMSPLPLRLFLALLLPQIASIWWTTKFCFDYCPFPAIRQICSINRLPLANKMPQFLGTHNAFSSGKTPRRLLDHTHARLFSILNIDCLKGTKMSVGASQNLESCQSLLIAHILRPNAHLNAGQCFVR